MNDRDKMITRIAKVLFSWFEDDEYTWDEVDDATTNPYRWKAESLVNTLLAPILADAEKWSAYQAELVKEKAHTERFISLMDAEEDELRRKARLWEKVEELARYKGDCGYCKNDDLCMKFPSSACYICEGVVHALKEAP